MKAGGLRKRRGVARRTPAAFSLAEMMIALIILGFGLLIIGAALPVGVRKTQETVQLEVGEEAAQYGLREVERCVRLSRTAYRDNLFRPRDGNGNVAPTHEPRIKVRPLIGANVDLRPGSPPLAWFADHGEELIRAWFGPGYPNNRLEVDYGPTEGALFNQALVNNPALCSVARVYPPVTASARFAPGNFFDGPYVRDDVDPGEEIKADEKLITWTAFYRRVSYATGSNPNWYEVIVVAARRPDQNYRFPMQNENGGLGMLATINAPHFAPSHAGGADETAEQAGAGLPQAGNIDGSAGDPLAARDEPGPGTGRQGGPVDPGGPPGVTPIQVPNAEQKLAPAPWHVVFGGLPPLPPLLPSPDATNPYPEGDRQIDYGGGWVDPATLPFTCAPAVAELLPVGSIFIPARNDAQTDNALYVGDVPPQRIRAGFVPHAPDTLPIYEVVENIPADNPGDPATILVKNNGYYPWVANNDPTQWPVWVIPPAFKERPGGIPVYDRRSPVLSVARKYVYFREID